MMIKSLNYTLAIIIIISFFSCETTDLPNIKGPTDIRIKNESAYLMQNVQVGGFDYGDIESGKTTAYQEFEVAYRYASVFLTIQDTLQFTLIPIDFVGETPLGKGTFTYTLNITSLESRSVSITPSED